MATTQPDPGVSARHQGTVESVYAGDSGVDRLKPNAIGLWGVVFIAVTGAAPISAMLFNVPYANESVFSPHVAGQTHEKRDYHNERLSKYCQQNGVPLADVCSHLRDEHLGDELHPNESGARIIAQRLFDVLASIHASG